ncbi:MAG: Rieske 2Fe-2S domain-containing protein, partial [Burkholderiaceae bacterium]|nr:Rieske 2Fe-2S domain-containing protein [Burkholderiaceae bacterium]
MSEALSYLIKARPEAMGHYFSFLKDAGQRLDPKTRNLISVITKVHAQTERGLRQYLKRALAEGATPAEVIDALLMAFPALGLAKIVWAMDVILAMELPGFDPQAIGAEARWHDLMAEADLPAGSALRVECDGRAVFVACVDGQTSVYDAHCPHQSTDIPQLALEGRTLTCPKHGWEFDIGSGACVKNGTEALKRYEHRLERGG